MAKALPSGSEARLAMGKRAASGAVGCRRGCYKRELTTLAFHEVTTCSRVGRAFIETVRDLRKAEDFGPRHRA